MSKKAKNRYKAEKRLKEIERKKKKEKKIEERQNKKIDTDTDEENGD